MPVETTIIKCKSIFSDDSQHRYQMSKVWDKNLPQANIITIAPSECYNIACDLTTNIITNNLYMLNFGGYIMTNLISKIGVTNIKKVRNTKDLWNNETDKHILSCAETAEKIIVAWGSFAHNRQFSIREKQVLDLLLPYQDKVYHITDGANRQFLHPLAPCVRNSFVLKPYSIK